MAHIAEQPRSDTPLRLAGLDGLRGLAACVVAFGYHAQYLFAQGVIPAGTGWFVGDWLRGSGWLAVDLFFVLSGFVFAHVYLTNAGDWRDFGVARFARLYPLHLVTLLFCLVTLGHLPGNTLPAFIAHLAMAQALVQPAGHTFNGPSWSLTVEIICYALFLLGLRAGGRWLRIITMVAICAGLIGVRLQLPGGEVSTMAALFRALLGFFIGQAIWRGRGWLGRIPLPMLIVAVLAALLVDPARFGSVLPVTLLGWPALLLMALRLKGFSARPLAWLGARSYAIYLIHMPLIDLVHELSGGGLTGSPALIAGAWLALIAATLILSDLAWRWLEQPQRQAILTAWQRRKSAANRTEAVA